MHSRPGSTIAIATFGLLVASLAPPVTAFAATSGATRLIHAGAVTTIGGGTVGSARLSSPELMTARGARAADGPDRVNRPADSDSRTGPGVGATGAGWSSGSAQVATSFSGLNHFDQRTANNGNQFSLEPPDQGLCVGAGFVLETVNDVLRVFDSAGNPVTGVTDLNSFYGYPPAINRAAGNVRGPFITDPSCYFDVQTQRFYHVALTLDTFSNGSFTGRNHLDIAVSNSSNPAGTWTIFVLPVQDDGTEGTPNHNCQPGPGSATATHPTACLGDFPHMGADANGLFITTNEFDFFGPSRRAAQIYAFSKRALAAGAAQLGVTQFDTTGLQSGQDGFTVWPTTSPGQFSDALNGTEFFLSSFRPAPGTVSNQLAVWSISNTQSVDSGQAELVLQETAVQVQVFSRPPRSDQKPGDFPLGQCLNDPACSTTVLGSPDPFAPEVESVLDSSDARILTAVFAGGQIAGALGTAVGVAGATKAGIAWFAIQPAVSEAGLSAALRNQGTLALEANNLIFPAIGITAAGRGAMAFTIAGADFFPSSGFTTFDLVAGTGQVRVIQEGLGPQDGFTEYKGFRNPPRPRWGDYGAAAVDGNSVWVASEFIGQTCALEDFEAAPFGTCNNTRTVLGNWGTRISQVFP